MNAEWSVFLVGIYECWMHCVVIKAIIERVVESEPIVKCKYRNGSDYRQCTDQEVSDFLFYSLDVVFFYKKDERKERRKYKVIPG